MTSKITIDRTAVLPQIADERDTCYQRLCDLVEARSGVDALHLIEREDHAPDRLCVHHDPKQLSVQDVRALTKRAGAELSEQYDYPFADVEPMRPCQARRISEFLRRVPGIVEPVVSPNGTVRVEYDRNARGCSPKSETGRSPKPRCRVLMRV